MTRAAIPADASDDLLRKLHVEDSRSVPVARRATCPDHLNWRDRCAHLHASPTCEG
jgi:hypothetical protein